MQKRTLIIRTPITTRQVTRHTVAHMDMNTHINTFSSEGLFEGEVYSSYFFMYNTLYIAVNRTWTTIKHTTKCICPGWDIFDWSSRMLFLEICYSTKFVYVTQCVAWNEINSAYSRPKWKGGLRCLQISLSENQLTNSIAMRSCMDCVSFRVPLMLAVYK